MASSLGDNGGLGGGSSLNRTSMSGLKAPGSNLTYLGADGTVLSDRGGFKTPQELTMLALEKQADQVLYAAKIQNFHQALYAAKQGDPNAMEYLAQHQGNRQQEQGGGGFFEGIKKFLMGGNAKPKSQARYAGADYEPQQEAQANNAAMVADIENRYGTGKKAGHIISDEQYNARTTRTDEETRQYATETREARAEAVAKIKAMPNYETDTNLQRMVEAARRLDEQLDNNTLTTSSHNNLRQGTSYARQDFETSQRQQVAVNTPPLENQPEQKATNNQKPTPADPLSAAIGNLKNGIVSTNSLAHQADITMVETKGGGSAMRDLGANHGKGGLSA